MKSSISLAPGVVVEPIGGEILVVVPGGSDVIRLSHDAASIVLALQAGKSVDTSSPTVAELLDVGILATTGFSRRGLVKAGAIGAGAGIAVLAMPQAAMAASSGAVALDLVVDSGATAAPYFVVVKALMGVGFVSPGGNPVAVSAQVGNDAVTSADISFEAFSNGETIWTLDTVENWNSTPTAFELVFTWGGITYRATTTLTIPLT